MLSSALTLLAVVLGALLALVLVGLLFLILVFIQLLYTCTKTAAGRADLAANDVHSPHYYNA